MLSFEFGYRGLKEDARSPLQASSAPFASGTASIPLLSTAYFNKLNYFSVIMSNFLSRPSQRSVSTWKRGHKH